MISLVKTLTVISQSEEILLLAVTWLRSQIKLQSSDVRRLDGVFAVSVRCKVSQTEISHILKRRFKNRVRVF